MFLITFPPSGGVSHVQSWIVCKGDVLLYVYVASPRPRGVVVGDLIWEGFVTDLLINSHSNRVIKLVLGGGGIIVLETLILL